MQELSEYAMDAYRLFLTFQWLIEQCPLQIYASALLFSPFKSHIKSLFAEHVPKWATIRCGLKERWPSHLHAINNLPSSRKVCYSKDGRRFISASTNDVVVRDTTTFACIQQFHIPEIDNLGNIDIELSLDGTKATWLDHKRGLIKILDIVHGTVVDMPNIPKSRKFLRKVVFSVFGDRIALLPEAGEDIEVWDTINGSLLCRIPADPKKYFGFCFLGASSSLASVMDEFGEPIRIWCTDSGQLEDLIPQMSQKSAITALNPFLNDSSRLLSIYRYSNDVTRNMDVGILDVVSKESIFKFSNPSTGPCFATISPDGDFILLVFHHDKAYICDLKEQANFQLEGSYFEETSGSATFSSDSKLLAIRSVKPYETCIWNIISRTIICKLNDCSAAVGSMTFSPNGRFLAMNTGFHYTKIWDISADNLELMKATEDNVGANVRISTVSFSRDSKWLAVVSKDEPEIEIWDKTDPFWLVLENVKDVEQITFSWNSTILALGTTDGEFGLINIAEDYFKENGTFRTFNSDTGAPVTQLEFSKDDSLLAIAQRRHMWFFNINNGQNLKVKSSGLSAFCAVKFYDNQLAVSIDNSGDIQMWNPTTGVCLKGIFAKGSPSWYNERFSTVDIRLFQGSFQIISTSFEKGGILNIIDVDTEKRIRTFKAEQWDFLEFDPDDNTVIHSDRGNIDLDQFNLSLDQITSKEERIVYHGYGVRGPWVMKDDRPILWIPLEYERIGRRCTISKSQIAIICRSEHLLVIDFTEENMDF
jgi:WD40 repeat protein